MKSFKVMSCAWPFAAASSAGDTPSSGATPVSIRYRLIRSRNACSSTSSAAAVPQTTNGGVGGTGGQFTPVTGSHTGGGPSVTSNVAVAVVES